MGTLDKPNIDDMSTGAGMERTPSGGSRALGPSEAPIICTTREETEQMMSQGAGPPLPDLGTDWVAGPPTVNLTAVLPKGRRERVRVPLPRSIGCIAFESPYRRDAFPGVSPSNRILKGHAGRGRVLLRRNAVSCESGRTHAIVTGRRVTLPVLGVLERAKKGGTGLGAGADDHQPLAPFADGEHRG